MDCKPAVRSIGPARYIGGLVLTITFHDFLVDAKESRFADSVRGRGKLSTRNVVV